MRSLILTCVFAVVLSGPALAQSTAPASQPSIDEKTLASIKPHPRLLLTPDRLAELKALAQKDAAMKKAVEDFIKLADLYLAKPPLKDSADWNTWREANARVFALGLAYRWTGEDKYAKSLREVLLTCAGFADWHDSSGFLDTAEMTAVVAIGYDWLYDKLSADDRKTLSGAITVKGLAKGLYCYGHEREGGWWIDCDHNYNLVCNSGMVLGALAVAEVEPRSAVEVLNEAAQSLQYAWPSYEPHGGWMEGPSYWEYSTLFGTMALAAGETALGEAGLRLLGNRRGGPIAPGLARTWQFALYTTDPGGVTVMAFADTLTHHWHLPFIFYLAGKAGDEAGIAYEHTHFGKPHPWWPTPDKEVTDPRHAANRALGIIWYRPATAEGLKKLAAMPLSAHLRTAKLDLASFRTAWGDPNAMSLVVKAGDNGGLANHGHCDAGSFVLTSRNVAWTLDPGRGKYSADYFDSGTPEKPGKRWQDPQVASVGHSVVRINDENQSPWASAPISRFEADGTVGFAVLDTSKVYPQATKASRGLWFAGGQYVLVQDELELPKAAAVRWQLVTQGKIEAKEDEATIDRWGLKMRVKVLEPAGAKLAVGAPASGVPGRLVLELPNSQGAARIAVLLVPPTKANVTVVEKLPEVKVQPLSTWKLESRR